MTCLTVYKTSFFFVVQRNHHHVKLMTVLCFIVKSSNPKSAIWIFIFNSKAVDEHKVMFILTWHFPLITISLFIHSVVYQKILSHNKQWNEHIWIFQICKHIDLLFFSMNLNSAQLPQHAIQVTVEFISFATSLWMSLQGHRTFLCRIHKESCSRWYVNIWQHSLRSIL